MEIGICLKCGNRFEYKINTVPHSPKKRRNYCSDKCYKQKWDNEHRDEKNATTQSVTQRKRIEILKQLGNRCSNPYDLPHPEWLNNYHLLQIDHIEYCGNKRLSRTLFYNKVLKSIKDGKHEYQLLCAACNIAKKVDNHEIKKSQHPEIMTSEVS